MTSSQPAVTKAFAELADTLVDDFDLTEFLHVVTLRVHEALEVDAVGMLLASNSGSLNVVAASSEQAQLLELYQLQNAQGPCLDCYHTGHRVSCPDLAASAHRWPRFAARALEAGFAAVHALPMRLRDEVIGGMNLFTKSPGPLDPDLLELGQALTDVATIGLLHQRAMQQHELLTQQLQNALNSRLTIEQAKGALAERRDITTDDAFELMRTYARQNHFKLTDVAKAVVRQDPEIAGYLLQQK